MPTLNCMKCGREVALGQAFCKDCLEDMSHYPINPGTPVQIPAQPPVTSSRRSPHPKKTKKPEELIIRLRKLVRLQAVTLLFLLAFLIGLGIYTIKLRYQVENPQRPGENYLTTEIYQSNSK